MKRRGGLPPVAVARTVPVPVPVIGIGPVVIVGLIVVARSPIIIAGTPAPVALAVDFLDRQRGLRAGLGGEGACNRQRCGLRLACCEGQPEHDRCGSEESWEVRHGYWSP